jgi:DNA-binding GntR family transcriptional regulator
MNSEIIMLGEIERSNLAGEIAFRLRESIVNGSLSPGIRLVESELASQLGVSRGTLREALRILETEGLVENFPGRGSYVIHISEKDISEIYSLRCILEEETFKRAAICRTDEDLDRLTGLLESMSEAAKVGDPSMVTKLDFEFHREIWEIADHRLLKEVLEGITTQIRMFLSVHTHLYDDLAVGISDHEALLETLRKRDSKGATEGIRNHLEEASEVVKSHFQRSEQRDKEIERG